MGRVWSEKELMRVVKICLDNEIILVSDEIHFDLLRKGISHTPVAKLFPKEDTIITCTAPTKTFNAAGLQISNIIIRNKMFQKKWSAHTGPELVSPLSVAGVKAAYNEGEEWLEQLLVYLDDNFTFMDRYLKKNLPGARFIIPQGTYLAWVDFSAYGYDDKKMENILLKEANVLVESGTMFGPEGSGFQRINIACPRSVLETALDQLEKAYTNILNNSGNKNGA